MSSTINKIRQERKNVFRELRSIMRKVDNKQEKTESLIRRVLNRKLNVPDTKDLQQVLSFTREALAYYAQFEKAIDRSMSLFGLQ